MGHPGGDSERAVGNTVLQMEIWGLQRPDSNPKEGRSPRTAHRLSPVGAKTDRQCKEEEETRRVWNERRKESDQLCHKLPTDQGRSKLRLNALRSPLTR